MLVELDEEDVIVIASLACCRVLFVTALNGRFTPINGLGLCTGAGLLCLLGSGVDKSIMFMSVSMSDSDAKLVSEVVVVTLVLTG